MVARPRTLPFCPLWTIGPPDLEHEELHYKIFERRNPLGLRVYYDQP